MDESSDDEALKKIEAGFKVYDSLDDDKIDFTTLGIVELDRESIMKYFPKNPKGVTFSSPSFIPIAEKPRAPNERLELSLKEHDEMLGKIDLIGLLKMLRVIKS